MQSLKKAVKALAGDCMLYEQVQPAENGAKLLEASILIHVCKS